MICGTKRATKGLEGLQAQGLARVYKRTREVGAYRATGT